VGARKGDVAKTAAAENLGIGLERQGKLVLLSDAHYYLTEAHEFTAGEIDYYLNFQDPLKLVAQEWEMRQNDMSDFSFAMDYINGRSEAVNDTPNKY
jgi:hypothetical protein